MLACLLGRRVAGAHSRFLVVWLPFVFVFLCLLPLFLVSWLALLACLTGRLAELLSWLLDFSLALFVFLFVGECPCFPIFLVIDIVS